MKVLVIGSNGMLGHEVFREFKDNGFEVIGTQRNRSTSEKNIFQLDLTSHKNTITETIENLEPEIVINCTGILKPISEKDYAVTSAVNSLAPHIIAKACNNLSNKAKLICVSSDCNFSGKIGYYTEKSVPDPTDFYGLSKQAGEVTYKNHLTIRTSIIGKELRNEKYNLLDWFLSQPEGSKLNGFLDHQWNGVTTTELAKFLVWLVKNKPDQSGLLHFHGEDITKFALLNLFQEVFETKFEILRHTSNKYCNRTLRSDILPTLGYTIPPLKEQLLQLKLANVN